MEPDLIKIQRFLQADDRLAGFEVRRDGDELHLEKSGSKFARLIPTEKIGEWRLEYYYESEDWEIGDFVGTLEECLIFLTTHPHYQFWER
jgi:hypothetical protein